MTMRGASAFAGAVWTAFLLLLLVSSCSALPPQQSLQARALGVMDAICRAPCAAGEAVPVAVTISIVRADCVCARPAAAAEPKKPEGI